MKASGTNVATNGIFASGYTVGNPRLNTPSGNVDAAELVLLTPDGTTETIETSPTLTHRGRGVYDVTVPSSAVDAGGPNATNVKTVVAYLRPRQYSFTADQAQATTSVTSSAIDGTFASNDDLNGWTIEFTSGTYAGQKRTISDYVVTGGNGQVVWTDALAGSPSASDTFVVYNERAFFPTGIQESVRDYDGDNINDAYTRIGAPAGASVSADVAAIKGETAAILVDTGTDIPALINALNDISAADVGTQVLAQIQAALLHKLASAAISGVAEITKGS